MVGFFLVSKGEIKQFLVVNVIIFFYNFKDKFYFFFCIGDNLFCGCNNSFS